MDISAILKIINITGTPQRVLLELLENGPQGAGYLAKKLSLPRPSIYDALHTLEERGLVVSQEENGKSVFSANHPDRIAEIIDTSREKLETAKEEFSTLVPKLLKSPRITEPKIQMFTGKEGCQQVMRDILWYEDIETYTLWPVEKMLDVLTPEFMEWHNKKRVKQGMSLKSLRKAADKTIVEKYPFMDTKPEDLREVRFLPRKIDFSMSYWIYGDKVAFVSAGKELYGFIVQSKEFVEMMKIHFNILWEQANS